MGSLSQAFEILTTRLSRMDRRLKQLERSARTAAREEDLSTFDPTMDNNFLFREFDLLTVECTSVLSATDFLGRILVPGSSSSTPWVVDTDYTSPLTITVPTNATMPSVGHIVSANFTGTYGSSPPAARFILLAGGAGGSSAEYVITEVHSSGNFLVCETTIGSVDGGSNVFVALPASFRKSTWDGTTIHTVTYAGTTSDPHFRLATNAATTALKQYEKILPSYRVGDIIVGAELSHNTTVVATYTDGSTLVSNAVNIIDANAEGRAWVRIGEP